MSEQPVKKRKPQFKLSIVTAVRLTEDEWEETVKKADSLEIKPSAYIRMAVRHYNEL